MAGTHFSLGQRIGAAAVAVMLGAAASAEIVLYNAPLLHQAGLGSAADLWWGLALGAGVVLLAALPLTCAPCLGRYEALGWTSPLRLAQAGAEMTLRTLALLAPPCLLALILFDPERSLALPVASVLFGSLVPHLVMAGALVAATARLVVGPPEEQPAFA